MDDEEIIACVAAAVNSSGAGARLETLSGRQGLLVCRVVLQDGVSYVFKAVKEGTRRELSLTALLAELVPGLVPGVIAYEEDTRRGLFWLIMTDVGSRRLADDPRIENYMSAARLLAQLQMALLERAEAVSALGVPVVTPTRWEEIALRVLESFNLDLGACMPLLRRAEAEIEAIAWETTELVKATLSLPLVLVHGDLHAGNVALLPAAESDVTSLCLLDWGSAYMGAAFLGLEELLLPASRHLRSQEAESRVRAAYLREWTPVLGKPGLQERALLASRILVRLELLDEQLRRVCTEDPFAVAAAGQRLVEAWRGWR